MNLRTSGLRLILVVLLLASTLFAQTADPAFKTFDKDGLKFSYPADWILTDKSTTDVQNLILSRPNSLLLISIVSPRAIIASYEQFRELQGDVNDRFIIAIKRGLNTDENVTREDSVCMNFNGRDVTGMRYTGHYKNEPSTGDVFPFVLGDRFVNLVYMRSDNDRSVGDPVWKGLPASMYLQNSHRDAAAFDFATDYVAAGDVRGRARVLAKPMFTREMDPAGFGATAVVHVEIDENGKVISADCKTFNGPLRLEVLQAAKLSRFEPAIVCGKPVKVRGVIIYKVEPRNSPGRTVY